MNQDCSLKIKMEDQYLNERVLEQFRGFLNLVSDIVTDESDDEHLISLINRSFIKLMDIYLEKFNYTVFTPEITMKQLDQTVAYEIDLPKLIEQRGNFNKALNHAIENQIQHAKQLKVKSFILMDDNEIRQALKIPPQNLKENLILTTERCLYASQSVQQALEQIFDPQQQKDSRIAKNLIYLILRTLDSYSERVRIRRSSINSGLSEEAKAGKPTRKIQQLLEGRKISLESVKEQEFIAKFEYINIKTNENYQQVNKEEENIGIEICNKDVPNEGPKDGDEEYREQQESSFNTCKQNSEVSEIISIFDSYSKLISSKDEKDGSRLTSDQDKINAQIKKISLKEELTNLQNFDFFQNLMSQRGRKTQIKSKGDRSTANDSIFPEDTKIIKLIRMMQQMPKRQIVGLKGVKQSQDNQKVDSVSVFQLPLQLSDMITPARDIESILSLYPCKLRTLHTIFHLDIDGKTSPLFLHSQVAFALIQISQGGGYCLRKFIDFYEQEDFLSSLVVVDDGKIIDLQIVYTLWIAHMCLTAHKADLKIPDMAFNFRSLWEDEIDISNLGVFFIQSELKSTLLSNIYVLAQSAIVKMPKTKHDKNKMLIINKVYERQIKRVIQYFYQENRQSIAEGFQSLDLFVISGQDPKMLLDYASISEINITLDQIRDPIKLEYWILIILDYLAFLHRCLNLVNLDINSKNIFLSKSRTDQYSDQQYDRGSNIIQMDMCSALVIDIQGDSQYFIQLGTGYNLSPKFLLASHNQTPVSAQDLIQEDHFQIVTTLDEVCKGRMDLTQETKLMLQILRSTNTIENAIYKINTKLELIHKIFREIRYSKQEDGDFAIGFLRNLDPKGLGNKSLLSIELLLQCERYDLAKQLFDNTISFLYPKFLYKDQGKEFRERFLSLSIVQNMQWLTPLLVLIDYLEFYQDQTEEKISKQLTLIEQAISRLQVKDQIKTYLGICHGFKLFLSRCQEHSKANWAYFSKHLLKAARQLKGLSEKEKQRLEEFYFELDEYGNYEAQSVILGIKKQSIQSFAFIGRDTDPQGLFQVLKKGKSRYFMQLTSQQIRIYRENYKQQLIELSSQSYRVESCHDGSMCVVDRDGMLKFIKNIDKFIEIDLKQKFIQAKESRQELIIQMTIDPGFQKIVGLKIGAWHTA